MATISTNKKVQKIPKGLRDGLNPFYFRLNVLLSCLLAFLSVA